MPRRTTRSMGDLPPISNTLDKETTGLERSSLVKPSNTGTGNGLSAVDTEQQPKKTDIPPVIKTTDPKIVINQKRVIKSRSRHRRDAKKRGKSSKNRSSSSSSDSSSSSSSSSYSLEKKYRKKSRKRTRTVSVSSSSSSSECDDYKKKKPGNKKKLNYGQKHGGAFVPENVSMTSKRTARRLREAEGRLAIIETHLFGAVNPSAANTTVPGQDNALRLQRNYYIGQNYKAQLPGQRYHNFGPSQAQTVRSVSTTATPPINIPVHTYRQIQVSTSNPSANLNSHRFNAGNSNYSNTMDPSCES